MKTRGFVVILFMTAFAFAPAKLNAGDTYAAKLITPMAGQVVYPGQTIRVEWRSQLPHNVYLDACEMEVFLSLDGGKTFNTMISGFMDPKAQYFYWTVPNTPTNQAVLDIRFGCEPGYPESFAPQLASTFVIAHAPAPAQ